MNELLSMLGLEEKNLNRQSRIVLETIYNHFTQCSEGDKKGSGLESEDWKAVKLAKMVIAAYHYFTKGRINSDVILSKLVDAYAEKDKTFVETVWKHKEKDIKVWIEGNGLAKKGLSHQIIYKHYDGYYGKESPSITWVAEADEFLKSYEKIND